jgi:hypothetical protein
MRRGFTIWHNAGAGSGKRRREHGTQCCKRRPSAAVAGDWFDVCRCNIPCPCEFAQPPTDNYCEGVIAYHVREGNYGDVRLDGLSLIGLISFEGNLWAGEA